MEFENKRVLTGVKPTGRPHLGNYYGAMKPAIELANNSPESLLFIADYHTLITVHDAQTMRQLALETAACWLASGVDPNKTHIYRQSDVPEIFEMTWILNCFTPKGLMNRAHAYKAKVSSNESDGKSDLDAGVSMGLFSYPVLMAADILTFNADIVPVGPDQVQHLEIARDIAHKINQTYSEVLKLPEFRLATPVAVPGIDGRKMSKSYNNHVPLFEDSKKMRKKIMKITTDSTPPEAPKDPKNSIIMDLYKVVATPEEVKAMETLYLKGVSWGEAKQILFECVDHQFKDQTNKFNELMAAPAEIESILQEGAHRARALAQPILKELKKTVGICG